MVHFSIIRCLISKNQEHSSEQIVQNKFIYGIKHDITVIYYFDSGNLHITTTLQYNFSHINNVDLQSVTNLNLIQRWLQIMIALFIAAI